MSNRFDHTIFVCQREREADHPKGSCFNRGSAELLDRLKGLMADNGLKGRVKIASASCLDYCKKGCTAVVYSREGAVAGETWYTHLTPDDAEALFDAHVLRAERYAAKVEPNKRSDS